MRVASLRNLGQPGGDPANQVVGDGLVQWVLPGCGWAGFSSRQFHDLDRDLVTVLVERSVLVLQDKIEIHRRSGFAWG